MTYSIDKCVKLLGYEYELPDEVILMIQRMVIDEKFKKSIRNCMCKIHMGVRIATRLDEPFVNFRRTVYKLIPFGEYRETPDFYEDGRQWPVRNPVRRCLMNANGYHNKRSPDRYIERIDSSYRNFKFMGQDLCSSDHYGQSDFGIEMNSILKRDMVEHMKNNGMKFNKSKTKPQLAHIYMNHKNLVEEEPFIYTYKNIKKIKYD
tara:strand:- start:111 stop:725 length:615 start_codon:yes stop_codon:yes gene_type:complete